MQSKEANGPMKNSQKSGVSNDAYVKILGGIPEKKAVEQIEKVNRPRSSARGGKAPGNVRV